MLAGSNGRFGVSALLCLFGFVTPASGQSVSSVEPPAFQRAFACGAIEDVRTRLTCYEDSVAQIRTEFETGELVAMNRSQVAVIERDAFGFHLSSIVGLTRDVDRAPIDQVEAHVAEIRQRPRNRSAFVLDNGQVWSQVESQRTSNVRMGDAVSIRRGLVGNYLLLSSRGGAAHRVRREE